MRSGRAQMLTLARLVAATSRARRRRHQCRRSLFFFRAGARIIVAHDRDLRAIADSEHLGLSKRSAVELLRADQKCREARHEDKRETLRRGTPDQLAVLAG